MLGMLGRNVLIQRAAVKTCLELSRVLLNFMTEPLGSPPPHKLQADLML